MAEIFNNNLQEFLKGLIKDEQTSFFTRDTLKDLTYEDDREYQDLESYCSLKEGKLQNYFPNLLETIVSKSYQFKKETLIRQAALVEDARINMEYALVGAQADYEIQALNQIQDSNKNGSGIFKFLIYKGLFRFILVNVIKALTIIPLKFLVKKAMEYSAFLIRTFLKTGVGKYIGQVFALAKQVLLRYTRVAAVSKFFVQGALTAGRFILTNPWAMAALGIITLAGGGYVWYRSKQQENLPYDGVKEGASEEVSPPQQIEYYSNTEGIEETTPKAKSGKKLVKPSPEILAAMKRAAEVTNVPLDWFIKMAYVESTYNPNAKAKVKDSSAKGLYQFIDPTWREMLKRYGKSYGVPASASPYDPYYSSVIAGAMWKGYRKKDVVDTYIAHNLGPGGFAIYKRALQKYPNDPATYSIVDEGGSIQWLRNNPAFFYNTFRDANGKIRYDYSRPLTMRESYAKYAQKLNAGNTSQMINDVSPISSQIINNPAKKQNENTTQVAPVNSNQIPISQMTEPIMHNGIVAQ